jgi:hypothetical protein
MITGLMVVLGMTIAVAVITGLTVVFVLAFRWATRGTS